jgi:hypothetical protein
MIRGMLLQHHLLQDQASVKVTLDFTAFINRPSDS